MKFPLLRNIVIGGIITAFGFFSLNAMTALAQGNGPPNRSNMLRNGQMMNPSHRGNWGQGHMMQNRTPEERQAIQECHDNMHQNWQSIMRHMQEAHPEMYRNQFHNESQQQPQ